MNLEALSLWALGALFGLRHALEPDHLAAVSALVTQQPGARTAVRWGEGSAMRICGAPRKYVGDPSPRLTPLSCLPGGPGRGVVSESFTHEGSGSTGGATPDRVGRG